MTREEWKKSVFENRKPIEQRFFDKVNKDGPVPEHRPELGKCWEWTGSKNDNGYGDFMVITGCHTKAPRVSYDIFYGPIRPKDFVLHRCDNPGCVNPQHLFIGTQADNIRDMRSKNRHGNKTFNGEENGFSKLSNETVDKLKQRYAVGGITFTKLGIEFGCSRTHAANIIHGKVRRLC